MWYAAYLCYLIGTERDASQSLISRVQEDLILLKEDTSEAALQRAVDLGAQNGTFGQDYLNAAPSALEVLSGEECKASDWPFLVHPSLASQYKKFSFLGIKRLVALNGPPGHGVEIDLEPLDVPIEEIDGLLRPKEEMQAYCPTGPAYEGADQDLHELTLFREYHWYLAEELFVSTVNERETISLRRLALINAIDPDNAFEAALADASVWAATRRSLVQFHGLGDLWLIFERDIRDCSELCSQIVEQSAAAFLASLRLFARLEVKLQEESVDAVPRNNSP